jgi:beta-mannosidase
MAADSMPGDLLAGSTWTCCSTVDGRANDPASLADVPVEWIPATVPGTAAGALRDGGLPGLLEVDYDGRDWWFRCAFDAPPAPMVLRLDGLATVADVWLNGDHVCHSENMLVGHDVDVTVGPSNVLLIRCAALTPLLGRKRPRPRWKTMLTTHQGLRWFRTTLLGRQPGWTVTPPPVGPWRPVRLVPPPPVALVTRWVQARVEDDAGSAGAGLVEVSLLVREAADAPRPSGNVILQVGEVSEPMVAQSPDAQGNVRLSGSARLPDVERWWPHTHGSQPLYPVSVAWGDGPSIDLGHVGFRSASVDRSDGGFELSVNGQPVFCRGAAWFPIDPVSMVIGDDELRRTLSLVREAGMNMLRIPGGTVYEDQRFWDLCDELGIMVWQDCMLGYLDPPDDEEFTASLVAELTEVLGQLGGRPSLMVLCGGQELEEQAAMFGLPREKWAFPIVTETVPALAERMLPGLPYVVSSPTGGDLPFRVDVGISHYFGVGTFLRPLDDARRANVRFMSEGLAFGVPPERQTVDEACGGAVRAGHDPGWKRSVHHDTGRALDLDDVREFYVHEVFGVDATMMRHLDPERSLDLGRAAVAEVMATVLSEWRRPGSPCAGALLIALRDLMPGPGWGIIDALGRPKAPWFALRRVLAPLAVLVTDEGVNGLRLHLVNDTAAPFAGSVRVSLFQRGEMRSEVGEQAVLIPPRGAVEVEATSLFDGFRDLSYAYRFGPLAYDVVAAELVAASAGVDRDGQEAEAPVASEVVWLPGGCGRPREADLGLTATVQPGPEGTWDLHLATRRFAQSVAIDAPGWRPQDSWFHLVPGGRRIVRLHPENSGKARPSEEVARRPSGEVRALNLQGSVGISMGADAQP